MNMVTSERRTKKGRIPGIQCSLTTSKSKHPILPKYEFASVSEDRSLLYLKDDLALGNRTKSWNTTFPRGTPKCKVSFICESLTQKKRLQIFKKKVLNLRGKMGKLRLRTQHVADPNHGTYRGASLYWWQQTVETPK